jgi:hypothetical protein
MRPLDQIPAGASTSPPVPERLSSLAYAPRRAGMVPEPHVIAARDGNLAVPVSAGPFTAAPVTVGPGTGSGLLLSGMTASAASAAAAAQAQAIAPPFVRLVPSSGVQFLDFTISADGLSRTVGQFTEDHIEAEAGQRTVLVDVGRDAGEDGVVWHPLTKRPLGPDEFLTISGFAALEPFLDTWMPLPYLRFRGRTPTGDVVHDPGPANWVRAYIAAPKEGLRAAKTLSVVLAFDTRLAPVYGMGDAADIGPSAYDALFGSTFQINDKLADLGLFVSEPWVDSWLQGSFNDFNRRQDGASSHATNAGASRFQLEHVARYLAYLAVLTRGALLPQIRFADSFSNAWQMPVTGVDLVLDMASETTCALLVVRDTAQGQAASTDAVLASMEPLVLRDLNNPVREHCAPPSTAIEFDGHNFGNIVASRRSGRTDAFLWPSLVRVGTEAERLALRTSATPGVTGRHSLFAGLNEIAISEGVWRFSRDDAAGVDQGPIVAGEALSHLTEDGTVIGRFDQTGLPAIRPRFSESSLIGLFVGELLMHALVQINRPHRTASVAPSASTPSTEASAGAVRQLQRILVTVASAVSDEDRRLLQTRIEGAIDLIWKAMRWDDEATVARPPKPQVSLGIGADVSAQLVYVFDEIKSRFGGDPTEYLNVLRRPATQRAASSFRIARLDFEAASTGLTIVDYDVANDGGVRPTITAAERSAAGRDTVLAGFANNAIWPAIAEQLQAAGVADARSFLTQLMADAAGPISPMLTTLLTPSPMPAHFSRRFDGKIIRPAAASILRSCEAAPARAVDTARVFTLKALVARGGGRMSGLAQHFDAAAAAAGAVNFRLENVTVRLRQRQAAGLIRQALEPVIAPFCELIAGQTCDLVVLDGHMAQVPDLVDELRRRLALPRHCFVSADRGRAGVHRSEVNRSEVNRSEVNRADGGLLHGRMAGAVGAYLASQQAMRVGNFKLVTTDVAASLQQYRPAAIARSGRPTPLLTDVQRAHGVASPQTADATQDGSGRTQGTLVRVTGADTPAMNQAVYQDVQPGAPRRRYAGAEREP